MIAMIYERKGIPFFHQKTELDFQQDIYERYHDLVVRQSALHIADELWDRYPFQPIFDFAQKHYPAEQVNNILELGCGVGRWIASLAIQYPKSACWGIDYSYQMLKRANEYWVEGREISIDLTDKGLDQQSKKERQLTNLKFGLAKTEKLPFDDNSQHLVMNSFLIDRLENPITGINEMYRILKPAGKLIIISPLNFKKSEHWKMYYPPRQLSNIIKEIGFNIIEWKEDIVINEPMDGHGNFICWNCIGMVMEK